MGLTDNNSKTIPKIMVFRPKLEEMKDFSKYLEYMEAQGAYKAGLAKIIPPEEWKPRKGGYDDIDITIKAPIQQVVTGGQGLYQQYNIQKKSMTVKDFKKLAMSSKYTTPSYFDYEDLERKYWKNVTFNPAIYGADVSGTLTDEDCEEFNINKLNTCLDMINESYGIRIMGVNTAYLYFGMWKTTFAWHTEDMDLYSINYLHFGSPKSWYCIPPEHGKRLERLANGFFPSSFKQCPAFLRHKMTLISPQTLKKYSIPFNKITQEAGEFMITFPYSYHAGYNHGYNCAESTNFALPRWVEFGKRAVRCDCRSDAVKISMEAFVKRFQPNRYELWLEGKDVGPDPKDPSHICAAPAPSTYEKDIMSKFNKHKRHPPHKKDFSDDDEDDDCSELEKWSPPTKAARKMFDNDNELELVAPSITAITPDTISSMPRPPTISETINRLHQNLNSSTEKPKEKKRKKKLTESVIPAHLEHHLYAKLNPCVSSCTQPNINHTNYGYFAQFSGSDSKLFSESFQSNSSLNYGFHPSNCSLVSTQSTTHSHSDTSNNIQKTLNFDSIKKENPINELPKISKPPQIKPYYEYSPLNHLTPLSKPPLLKPPETGQTPIQLSRNGIDSIKAEKFSINNRFNGINNVNNHLKSSDNRMVEASTSTEDLVGVPRVDLPLNSPLNSPSNSSSTSNYSNNKTDILEDLTKKTLQYTPYTFGPSPQGFSDEIAFNICMSTISPHCAVCNLLRPYQLSSKLEFSDLESWTPPKSSQILIPSVAFTSKVKDETTLIDSRETSPLIVCMDCRICVHSVCYGVSDLLFDGSERDWKCDRCANKDYFALCYLCPLRGGPLKQTTEKINEKKWVHLSCSLLVPDIKFVNGIAKRPIDLTDLKPSRRTDKMGCVYCRKVNPENKMVDYLNGYCIQCSCFASFHVTCGHRNGVEFKSGDWPDPILISCLKCSNISQSKKTKDSKRMLTDVAIDENIIAKHKNRRFYTAKVIDKFEQIFHHVHFVDNSFTKVIKSCDILNRDCVSNPPEIGDAVEVIWNKEQLHGKYTGKHSCLLYSIMFDDGSQIKAKREDFYLLTDELPKSVKSKLSTATDRQYLLNEESG